MRTRFAWIALLAAPAVIIAAAANWPATPDADRAEPADPPVRNVSPRPEPPVRRQVCEVSLPREVTPPRDADDTSPASVRGRIVHASSRRPVLSRVALVPVDDGRPANPSRLAAGEGTNWTENQQRFDLERMPPGRYLLGISFLDGTVGASKVVDLAPGDDVLCDLSVPALDVHEDVLVRVVGPDGRVVAGADVQAGFSVPGADARLVQSGLDESFEGSRGGRGRMVLDDLDAVVRADEDGTARVRHDAPGAPRNGLAGTDRLALLESGRPVALTHFVEAASKDFPRTRVIYDPRRDREVTVRFAAPALLTVTVEGLPTNPDCDQLRLVLVPKAGGDQVWQEYAGDGKFRFAAAHAGAYELRLELARRDEPGVVLSSQDLRLADGPRAVSVGIPKLFTLTVTSPAGVRLEPSSFGYGLVRVVGARRERISSTATVEGASIVFRELRCGTFCVSSWSKDAAGEMTFTATDDFPLAWRPAAPNALRVELDGLRKDDDVHWSRLASGDLVVAIDGVPCWSNGDPLAPKRPDDESDYGACFYDTVRLTVLRDGKEVEISSSPGSVPSRVWLRPATR